jgi:starch synthase (maltosyl-transferring)
MSSSRILISNVRPAVDGGRFPAKRVAGAPCRVRATIFRDGHERIDARILWRREDRPSGSSVLMELTNPGLDEWAGEFPLETPGRYLFTIEAWTDRYESWLADLKQRAGAGSAVGPELAEGIEWLAVVRDRARGEDRKRVADGLAALQKASSSLDSVLQLACAEELRRAVRRAQPRPDAVMFEPELRIIADRERAVFGAWYEMFPRSQGKIPGRPSTLLEARDRLADIEQMGFDVLYLPPIHPIGRTHRKGRNNSLTAQEGDPGSPWAIGSEQGGHDAIDPALGTLEDWDRFVAAAAARGLEIALDFALQCSPDHPWVKEHPEWFYRRPDGTVRCAENPPMKFEDIYPLNFDTDDRMGLWREMLRILRHWIGHGVKIFRVDNPHTKPIPFWEWLIGQVQKENPEVVFLGEAFTRPPMMKTLAKAGFSQSYTYFTWRHTKAELVEYVTELAHTDMAEYFRPNFFANTPDILPKVLVEGGRPAFKLRLLLAATLSPSYGIYSGFELCENEAIPHHAIPGDVEYADSEKFEIRVRDWDRPGNIKEFVARVNRIRRENPALRELSNVRFWPCDNDEILFFCKSTEGRSNVVFVAVNLDPSGPQEGHVRVPLEELGLPEGAACPVRDLLTGARYTWGDRNYVRLDPAVEPAHVLRIETGSAT